MPHRLFGALCAVVPRGTLLSYAYVEGVAMIARMLRVLSAILVAAFAFALAAPGSAEADVEDDTAVSIAGTLTGPSGAAKLGVHVRGTAERLSGTGGSAHITLASPATFSFDGGMDGSVVTLDGRVAHAAFEFLEGTPVRLTADTDSGRITMSFGPIPAGPMAGKTLRLTGKGNVNVTDPRVGAFRLHPA